MSATPRVSVIINFYNAGSYLAEAIASLEAQDFTDWELVLVDDGSQDESTQVARRAVESDPRRLRLVSHRDGGNHGMSASRNLGLAHARGSLVSFLDADDVWLPHKLTHEVGEMERRPELAMLGSAYSLWYSWDPSAEEADRLRIPGRRFYGETEEVLLPSGERLEPPGPFAHLSPAGRATSPLMSATVFRASALRRVGGFVDSFRGMLEDQVVFTKLYLEAPVALAEEPVALYRQHEAASMTATSFRARYRARAAYQQWLAAYLQGPAVRELPWYPQILEEAARIEATWRKGAAKRRLLSLAEPLLSTRRLIALRKRWVR